MNLFIGIDIGTSGIRAIAIDENRNPVAEHRAAMPAPHREQGVSEQAPEIWRQTLVDVIKELTRSLPADDVCALAVDATSGTLLAIDKNGKPLCPALMYNDARAHKEATHIATLAPATSAAQGASSGLAKWCWLKNNYPDHDRIVHQADWINGQLCGRYNVTDKNNALKTGFDPVANEWPQWLSSLGVNLSQLPAVAEPATPIAAILPAVAEELGLGKNVMIMSGTTDSTASFIATGCHEPGQAVTSLGSTLVIKIISSVPVFSAQHGVYSQPLGDHWLVGGASNSGGAVLKHYFSDEQIGIMTTQLKPEQPTGLDYYPLIQNGERFPHNDPEFAPRLTPRPQDNVEFFQAMLEGIANIEYEGYKLLQSLGAPWPTSVVTTGGGANNKAWTKIRAQKLGISVTQAEHQQAAYGAALLALKGFGKVKENE